MGLKDKTQVLSVLKKFYNLQFFNHIIVFIRNDEKQLQPVASVGDWKPSKISHSFKPGKTLKNKYIYQKDTGEAKFLANLFDQIDIEYFCKLSLENQNYFIGFAPSQNDLKFDESLIKILLESLEQKVTNSYLQSELERYADRTRQMIEEIGALHEVSRAIESSENLESLLIYIVEKSMQLICAESGSLMMVIEESNELEFTVALGPKSAGVKPFRLPIGKGISGWVAQHGEPILIPDAYADSRFDPSFDKRSGYRTKSFLCVPLIHNSKTIGVMTVLNRLDGQAFNDNDKTLLTTFATQAALAIENARLLLDAIEKERIEKELEVASGIQQLLIPQSLPKIPGLDIASTYIPCKAIGGDFYDVIQLDEQRVFFVVADVSGKGVPGALIVSNMQASLKAYLEYNDELKTIIGHLNKRLIQNTSEDRYVTCFVGMYDKGKSSFTYINAGHNPPLFVKNNGDASKLTTGGIFMGYLPWQYESDTLNLEKGDMLTLYTDGVVEAMNDKEEEFGEEALIALLKYGNKNGAESIKNTIIAQVREHQGNESLEDDFTLLVVKKD